MTRGPPARDRSRRGRARDEDALRIRVPLKEPRLQRSIVMPITEHAVYFGIGYISYIEGRKEGSGTLIIEWWRVLDGEWGAVRKWGGKKGGGGRGREGRGWVRNEMADGVGKKWGGGVWNVESGGEYGRCNVEGGKMKNDEEGGV